MKSILSLPKLLSSLKEWKESILLGFILAALMINISLTLDSEEINTKVQALPPPFMEQIENHEGKRLKPYRDNKGKLHIGIGRNLEDIGISEEEAQYLLRNDLQRVRVELTRQYAWFPELDEVRQDAIMNMAFNMGTPTLRQFRRMAFNLSRHEYRNAAYEALDSKWAKQVGTRAFDVAYMIQSGKYPPNRKGKNYGTTIRNNYDSGWDSYRRDIQTMGYEAGGSRSVESTPVIPISVENEISGLRSKGYKYPPPVDSKGYCVDLSILRYITPKVSSPIYRYGSDSWLDGMGKWVPIPYRRKGGRSMETAKWPCDNSA